MKPRILISARSNYEFYRDAVEAAEGEAILYVAGMDDTGYDGLLLTGGRDVNPCHYGEEINGSVNVDDVRDAEEFALIRTFLAAKLPIFGICRGQQILNVALGGSLCQHLPNTAEHKTEGPIDKIHPIRAEKDSLLYRLYGSEFVVNSVHHQAIARLADGLRATAWSDEVIEAVEHTSLPIFAVQFHPERLCGVRSRPDTINGAPLFEHFIAVCRGSSAEKA